MISLAAGMLVSASTEDSRLRVKRGTAELVVREVDREAAAPVVRGDGLDEVSEEAS